MSRSERRLSGIEWIVSQFEDYFENWKIWFPRAGLTRRWEGEIDQAGWTVLYQWGRTPRGEYLQVYARHRMTNDRHFRLHENRRIDALPAAPDCILIPDQASEAERRRIRRRVEKQTTLADEIIRRTWQAQERRLADVARAAIEAGWEPELEVRRIEVCGPIDRWRGVDELEYPS